MNILVLGAGAREHSLVYSLSKSPGAHQIFACPGNAGMAGIKICRRVPFRNNSDLVRFCADKIDLAVIGSSIYVEKGTVDALVLAGIPVIGPAADAGRIETSKAFAAEFMARHHIPSPVSFIAVNLDEIDLILARNPLIRVVKCDGFSRGSGVAVTDDEEKLKEAATLFLKNNSPPLILQERLTGIECSYSILTDGKQWVSFSSCRDYKRAYDGEQGPTTGGMGAVSPSPDLSAALEKEIITTIVQPTVNGMKQDGLLYRGFLSFQLMLTDAGPMVLEFNARLGDPETQSILARFRGDLAGLLKDCSMGCLSAKGSEVAFGRHSAVSVVVAREDYPLSEKAKPLVTNFDEIKEDVTVFFSSCRATENPDAPYAFRSGRLFSVTAVDETLEQTKDKCYAALAKLKLDKTRYRTDIGRLPSG